MLTFKWGKSYETKIESIDEQHKNLVAMINKLGENLQSDAVLSPEMLEKYFKNISLYAKVHFADEENCMKTFSIDERHQQVHKKAHTMFLQEATRLYNAISKNSIGAEVLFNFLSSWLAIHILGTDKILARQIRAIQNGLNPKDAYNNIQENINESVTPLLFAVNQLFARTVKLNRNLLNLNKSLESQVKSRTRELQQANNSLRAMALTDTLTKLGNRRAAIAFLYNEWNKSFNNKKTITCIMIDVDKFKYINDTQGHEVGDKVLVMIANTIRETARNDDFVCRLGGDEFVVLSNTTNLVGIRQLAEKILKEVRTIKLKFSKGAYIGSVSMGIAQRDNNIKTYIELFKKADEGLYIAKQNGRNGIGCAQSSQ